MLFLRTGSTASELKAALLRTRQKRRVEPGRQRLPVARWGMDEPCSMQRDSQASSGSLEQAGFSIGKIKISMIFMIEASVEPAITSWSG